MSDIVNKMEKLTGTLETIDLESIGKRVAAQSEAEAQIAVRHDRAALLAYVRALRQAAGRVTCERCIGTGRIWISKDGDPPAFCPDCADLRRLLAKPCP